MRSSLFDYEWQFLTQMITRIHYTASYEELCRLLLEDQLPTLIPFDRAVVFQTGRQNGQGTVAAPYTVGMPNDPKKNPFLDRAVIPRWSQFIMAPHSTVFLQSDLIAAEDWIHSDIYRNIWEPCRLYWALGATIQYRDRPLALVALFILFSAYKAAKETLSPLLGQAPDPALVQQIRDIVLSNDTVLGVHDLVVHDYGPGRLMITLHAEVPAHGDIMAMHDVIDNIEKELMEKLHCHAVIHMDPIVTDGSVTALKEQVAALVKQVDPGLTIHDFRVVRGTTHDNLIFDAVLPFSSSKTPAQAAQEIRALVRAMDGNYYAVVTVEHSYTD